MQKETNLVFLNVLVTISIFLIGMMSPYSFFTKDPYPRGSLKILYSRVYDEESSASSYRKKDEVYETDPSSVVMQFDESFQNAQVFKVDDYPDNSTSSSTTRARIWKNC